MKISAVIEDWDAPSLRQYGRACAHALARAHARTGDAAMMSGYMGSGQTFDDAVGEFAVEYADQNRSDYRAFVKAIRDRRIQATTEG
jgi:predicted alpha/beta hydrolase